jgi:hypothetical protein
MLRVVLTLDCDRCRQSYYKAAVCTDPESFFWESYASDLKDCAGFDGWYMGEDDTEQVDVLCDECVEERLKGANELAVEHVCN